MVVSNSSAKLSQFFIELQKYKDINPDTSDDIYDKGRHTYCHIIWMNKEHNFPKFEVRGWALRGPILNVSVVNWTVTAGTASLSLNDDNLEEFKILEDDPTLMVLYGR